MAGRFSQVVASFDLSEQDLILENPYSYKDSEFSYPLSIPQSKSYF
jgi:hypothetical protein